MSTGCDQPTNCPAQVADTVLQQGQGMHGSFSRGDTMNFMAAIGPDFKAAMSTPSGQQCRCRRDDRADIGTALKPNGNLIGRAMTEAMPNGVDAEGKRRLDEVKSSANGLRTVLNFQRVGNQRYFDAAGIPGRTVGLDAEPSGKQKTAGK